MQILDFIQALKESGLQERRRYEDKIGRLESMLEKVTNHIIKMIIGFPLSVESNSVFSLPFSMNC